MTIAPDVGYEHALFLLGGRYYFYDFFYIYAFNLNIFCFCFLFFFRKLIYLFNCMGVLLVVFSGKTSILYFNISLGTQKSTSL